MLILLLPKRNIVAASSFLCCQRHLHACIYKLSLSLLSHADAVVDWSQWRNHYSVTTYHKNSTITGTCKWCHNPFSELNSTRGQAHILGFEKKGISVCTAVTDEYRSKLKPSSRMASQVLTKEERVEPPTGQSSLASGKQSLLLGSKSKQQKFRWRKDLLPAKAAVDAAVARAFYVNHLPLTLVRSEAFKEALSAVADFGVKSGGVYEPPGYNAIREKMLKDEKNMVASAAKDKRGNAKYGGTLVSDAWTDGMDGHHIVGFVFVHKDGAEFLGGEDVTGLDAGGTGEFLAKLMCQYINELGPERVVQVCTDNAANCKAAGKIVEKTFSHITWTGCSSHGLDLLLEDFGKEEWVAKVCETGKTLVRFLTRYSNLYHKLCSFSGNKKVVKPVETRFGTMYMMLNRLKELQPHIERLVTDPVWQSCVHKCPDPAASSLKDDILRGNFWEDVHLVCDIMQPLYGLMILLDGNMPAAGKVYYHMYDCKQRLDSILDKSGLRKETIARLQARFDERWEFLHSDVHAVGYMLDPEFQKHAWIENREVTAGFDRFVKKVFGVEFWKGAKQELLVWMEFDDEDALSEARKMPGYKWFMLFGSFVPKLQLVAYKVLPLVSSACSCERAWSIFGHVHNSRRNKLQRGRINDLVYVSQNIRMLYASADAVRAEKYIEYLPGEDDECGEDEPIDLSYFEE